MAHTNDDSGLGTIQCEVTTRPGCSYDQIGLTTSGSLKSRALDYLLNSAKPPKTNTRGDSRTALHSARTQSKLRSDNKPNRLAMKIIDCTLRDGGYYTNWDFSEEVIERYLNAISASGVDACEIGFRSLINTSYKGALAFSTDEFLDRLNIPSNISLAAMINASELPSHKSQEKTLNKLFPRNSKDSKISLVRIAAHFQELSNSFSAAHALIRNGYRVCINLMQISSRTNDEIIAFSKMAAESEIEAVYFADSTGSMTTKDVEAAIKALSQYWHGAIGVHMHDNTGRALSNTLHAKELGASWLDSTITGMGRGAGNAKTEELLVATDRLSKDQNSLVPLLNLVEEYLEPLKAKHKWGSSPYYYIAAMHSIHPSYVQEMVGDPRFCCEDILASLEYLRSSDSSRYKQNRLENARSFYLENSECEGEWCPSDQLEDREVLLIGPGERALAHKAGIENYIKRTSPVVISLNANRNIADSLIDFRIACHPIRMMADADILNQLNTPLITPLSVMVDSLKHRLNKLQPLNFGLQFHVNTFRFMSKGCIIPSPLVLGYALAVATSGKAKKITLVGFDGYEEQPSRNSEIQSLLDLYLTHHQAVKITSMTPTSYSNLPSQSIYSLY